jgi:hypothetical protein
MIYVESFCALRVLKFEVQQLGRRKSLVYSNSEDWIVTIPATLVFRVSASDFDAAKEIVVQELTTHVDVETNSIAVLPVDPDISAMDVLVDDDNWSIEKKVQ